MSETRDAAISQYCGIECAIQLRMSGPRHESAADASDMALAEERDDRHTHPE